MGILRARKHNTYYVLGLFSYFTALRFKTPKMAPKWLQERPKRPQDGPKWPQECPKRAQEDPKMAPRRPQDGPKTAPSRFQDAFKNDFMLAYFQDPARSPQDPPKDPPQDPQDNPRTLPRHPHDPPRGPHDPCLAQLGLIFDPSWEAFGPTSAILNKVSALSLLPSWAALAQRPKCDLPLLSCNIKCSKTLKIRVGRPPERV